jgi:hypothetical protein
MVFLAMCAFLNATNPALWLHNLLKEPTKMYQMPDQRFSFEPSYSFKHKLITTQLKQEYWVTNRAKAEFKQKHLNKLKTDVKVEAEVIRRLEKECSKAKKEKKLHLKKA